jgi:hypothetical protein
MRSRAGVRAGPSARCGRDHDPPGPSPAGRQHSLAGDERRRRADRQGRRRRRRAPALRQPPVHGHADPARPARRKQGRRGRELLRALSEDFEEYLDVVEAGGDEDSFLEARRHVEDSEARTGRKALLPNGRDARTQPANRPDWSLMDPAEIPVDGLNPNLMSDWSADQRLRAQLSHYLDWLDEQIAGDETLPRGPECPAAFDRFRRADPDSSQAFAGEGDQLQADGGVLRTRKLPHHGPPGGPPPQENLGRNESPWQASTSSTSPTTPASAGGDES